MREMKGIVVLQGWLISYYLKNNYFIEKKFSPMKTIMEKNINKFMENNIQINILHNLKQYPQTRKKVVK